MSNTQMGARRTASTARTVSDDGKYDKSLPLTAGTKKGNLLSLKFEKVLPGQVLLALLEDRAEEVPFFEHVPFRNILDEAGKGP